MNKRLLMVLSVLVILGVFVAACGPEPTQVPATEAPGAPTAEPPEPTSPPAVTVTLWHAWTGAEETVLKDVVADFQAANPNITVELLAIPFDQLQTKFTTEAGAGGGPDIIIGPTDWVGPLAEAGLLAKLDDLVAPIIGDYLPATVDALRWRGDLYGFPESFEAVAMFYNTNLVDTPPTTMDEALAVAADAGMAFNTGFYHSFGFIPAFGGQLFDEEFICVLDQGGTVDFLQYLVDNEGAAGVESSDDGGLLDTLFKEEQVGIIFNGPWALGDYVNALGEDVVGVAPLPKAEFPAGPFLGVKHIMFNANSDEAHMNAAYEFVKYMTNAENSAKLMDEAGHLPANLNVEIPADSVIGGFIEQAKTATPFPNVSEMGAVWTPGGDMIKKAIAGEATPEEAVTEATQLINVANDKIELEPITIVLWHAWTGAEETVLKDVVAEFQAANAHITVDLLAIPFDQLQTKFTTEAGAGGGPDIIIGPTDWVGPLAEAGLLANLDTLAGGALNDYIPATVDALRWQGDLYGIPESFEAVAMFYNTNLVDTPPTTMDEALAVAADAGMAFNTGFYHSFGFIPAFGGQLFDEDFVCVLDQGGTVDFLQYLVDNEGAAGVESSDDGGLLDTLFKEEQVGIIFNGPWALGDYVNALGEDVVGVAPLPAATNPAGPFLGVKHIMFNANSDEAHMNAAFKFVRYLTNPLNSAKLMDEAGHLPANVNVEIPADAVINGFIEQALTATPFPNVSEMGAVWTPGGDMIKKAIAGEATPEEAVTEATQLINEANAK
jgi:arabinogalactan oligomer/maltooligosaccharide transport system substrate-binding protein